MERSLLSQGPQSDTREDVSRECPGVFYNNFTVYCSLRRTKTTGNATNAMMLSELRKTPLSLARHASFPLKRVHHVCPPFLPPHHPKPP